MKNKIIKIMFVSVLSLSLIGCGKEEVKDEIIIKEEASTDFFDGKEENIEVNLDEIEVLEGNNKIEDINIAESESEIIEEFLVEEVVESGLENIYWINNDFQMAFYFENGIAHSVGFGIESTVDYTFGESTITMDGQTMDYIIIEDKITFSSGEGGIALIFVKGTEEDYNSLITPTNFTTDSEYVGLTVRQFYELGAVINGYTGIGNSYTFSGYNNNRKEIFKIILAGDVENILDSKDFDDDYVDILGDFVIESIEIFSNKDLSKYVGKTIFELENDGFEVDGHFNSFDELVCLYATTPANQTVQIFLEDSTNASILFNSFEDVDDYDLGYEFSDFIISKISYSFIYYNIQLEEAEGSIQ